jgi:solute carrier family 25 protein 39/40
MSGTWDSRPSSANQGESTFEPELHFGEQNHDRLHGDNPIPGESTTIAMSGDTEDIDIDITAGQKMISAMSGSLLTSLLGTPT